MTPTTPLDLHGPDPTVSIIVPVYNGSGYVTACLESLRRQSFEDFEVIVVDDGSTDDSLLETWRVIGHDPRFHVVTRQNGGLSAARNTGLRITRGAFIGFVDSDDRVAPNYLESLLSALAETGAAWAAIARADISWPLPLSTPLHPTNTFSNTTSIAVKIAFAIMASFQL